MIAFKEHPRTSSYSWDYRGGCYEDGDIGVYEKGSVGEEYRFNNIPIEVREDESLSVLAGNIGSKAISTATPLFNFLSLTCFTLSIVSGLAFVVLYFR